MVEDKGKNEEVKRVPKLDENEAVSQVVNTTSRQTPSGDVASSILRPFKSTQPVPPFYIPMGRSTLSPPELDSAMENVQTRILQGLALPIPTPTKSVDGVENVDSKIAEPANKSDDQIKEGCIFSANPNIDSPIPFTRFDVVTKVSITSKSPSLACTCKFPVHI